MLEAATTDSNDRYHSLSKSKGSEKGSLQVHGQGHLRQLLSFSYSGGTKRIGVEVQSYVTSKTSSW